MMKLSEIYKNLLEAKQVGVVYHWTSMANAINILKDDKIKNNSFTGLAGKIGLAISTTRDKGFVNSRYKNNKVSTVGGTDIGFVLDGNNLSDRYQVRPYNDADSNSKKKLYGDEMEEIWYGKALKQDGGFKNLRKYIIKLIISKEFQYNIKYPKRDVYGELFGWDSGIPWKSRAYTEQEKLELTVKYFSDLGFNVEIQK